MDNRLQNTATTIRQLDVLANLTVLGALQDMAEVRRPQHMEVVVHRLDRLLL